MLDLILLWGNVFMTAAVSFPLFFIFGFSLTWALRWASNEYPKDGEFPVFAEPVDLADYSQQELKELYMEVTNRLEMNY